ncbi:MAG TPA: 2'-5' RNA ligase family protein [Chloroflexota bacterium]|nr:2'-5' RNA ligase family protein [Chloroflexota bacterium]
MHLVVELFFDPETEAAVRGLWAALAAEVPALVPHPSGARPHVSIAVYEQIEVPRLLAALGAFAAEPRPMEVAFGSWGAFAGAEPVVFLAPTPTRALLALHAAFHHRFAAFGPAAPYYRPGGWTPHCTLALGFPVGLLPDLAAACNRIVRPLHGRVEAIGLVRYGPRREIAVFPLGGSSGAPPTGAATPRSRRLAAGRAAAPARRRGGSRRRRAR